MRLWRCLCLVLLCAVTCCCLFAVSVSAVEGYPPPEDCFSDGICNGSRFFVFENKYGTWLNIISPGSSVTIDGTLILFDGSGSVYALNGSSWSYRSITPSETSFTSFISANFTIYSADGSVFFEYFCEGIYCSFADVNKDNICDDCGCEFAVLRDYSPFTVKKFMNHIGQILTSAVSWVGDVGSTILQQPLLLAFTALPLCGLGIAVFRRLKETV